MSSNNDIHIPYLSEDEKLFLNTTAVYSQKRRMSSAETIRPPSTIEDNMYSRRHQVKSMSSLSFLWKRRGSASSSLSTSSLDRLSIDTDSTQSSTSPKSPKARELESLIFEQPQRTVRLSLTPRCAI